MPQPSANQLTTLDGLFKERFADKLENAIPEITDIQVQVKFMEQKRLGKLYRQPVILAREHGCKYVVQGDGLVTLETPVAGQIKPAEVVGTQHIFRGWIDYASIFEAEGGPNEQAFDNSVGVMVANLLESHRYRLELDLFWGQDSNGLGTISNIVAGPPAVYTITTAQWASGIWNGAENGVIETVNAALNTVNGTANITAVDADARTITVDASPAGTIVTDVIFYKGMRTASAFKTMIGLHKILSNTSGTLFNISSTDFSLWRGNTFSAGSVDLAFEHSLKAFAKLSVKGGTGDYIQYVAPVTFANMMNDQGALRRYERSDSPASYVVGAKSITFYTQTGSIEIKGHPMEKESLSHIWQKRLFSRVGATDITFDTAKMDGISGPHNQFFLPIPDKNGVEIRSFDEQALFPKSIGKNAVINNIVNS